MFLYQLIIWDLNEQKSAEPVVPAQDSVVEVAVYKVAGLDFLLRGHFFFAALHALRAARVELAAGRRIGR